jgi:hypothetical protein
VAGGELVGHQAGGQVERGVTSRACRGGRNRGCTARASPAAAGSTGWVRSRAWTAVFSSTQITHGAFGWLQVKGDDVTHFVDESGSVESLKVSSSPGLGPKAFPRSVLHTAAQVESIGIAVSTSS